MVHANYCAPHPKQPCVVHEANMWYPYYMMSFVLKSSTKFSQVSWSVLWLRHQVVTDVTVWPINPNPSCSKNRKIKQNKNKNNKWNRKTSPPFVNLTGGVLLMECEDGLWRPVAFLFKSLNEMERNYEIHDKEILAIIRGLESWRYLLKGA